MTETNEVKHSETPWKFAVFSKVDGTPILTAQDVADTLAQSALKSDIAELWGVSLPKSDEDGTVVVVCFTGNGPTSRQNAEFIARACNAYKDLLAACRLCHRICEQGDTGAPFDRVVSAMHAASNAIAKAEAA